MFFGGFSGATAFFPERITNRDFVPHVVLTGFEIAGVPAQVGGDSPLSKMIGFTRQVTLSPDENSFSVEFSALSFGSPRTNRYRYKLDGLDEHWHEVHADRRFATYTTLPAGNYTLRVTGATARGQWSDPGVALSITILPHWWMTWWFRTLLAALLLASLMAAYYLRVQQISRQFDIRSSERSRIARELHDSLLQGFQGLMFCIQAARDLLPNRPAEAVSVLEKVVEQGDRVIAEGRDAVHDLRSPAQADNDLAKTLTALGEEMRAGIPTGRVPVCRVVIEGKPRPLDLAVRDEVYRIIREAYRNAFQHSRAAQIEAEISYGARRLWIRIRDDGIGIDPQVLTHGQRPGHWGLPGMRERATAFGGRLTLWSEPGAGTEVELRIPASIAYWRAQRRPVGLFG
jgi:signal transduction histidine kinase